VLRFSRGDQTPRFILDIPTTLTRPARRAGLAVFAAVLALAACKETADPPAVAEISGMAAVDSVSQGQSFRYPIELRDASGNVLTGRRVEWTTQNPQVASVDEDGLITGLAVGPSLITAKVGSVIAQSLLHVQPAVASVVVLPQASSVVLGGTTTLNVAVSDPQGRSISGRTIIWSSSNTTVATVNAQGVVAGVTQGSATITARTLRDGVSGNATVNVIQVPVNSVSISPAGAQTVFEGSTVQLTAIPRDANNTVLNGRPVTWSTSNQSVAAVSASGVVTGIALGTAQITAEVEGKTASSEVRVAPRPVATVSLSPNPGAVNVGAGLQMTVDVRDANNQPLTLAGRTVTWDSSNRPVAAVAQDGVVTGVTVGTATISVTVDGRTASATVTVHPAPPPPPG
jgi:uncharacterized protein YjdB